MLEKKRGVSVIIGYLLLVSFAIILSGMIYIWMKTYIPTETAECPSGVSIYIKEANCSYNGSNYILELTLKNNGRFNISGYYIHASNNSSQKIAITDIYDKIETGGIKFGNTILFSYGNLNTLEINGERKAKFVLEEKIYLLSIIPTRFNEIEGKIKYVGCNNGRIEEKITCS
jgi:hypothetical protein